MKTDKQWYFRMQQAEMESFKEGEHFELLIYMAIKSYSGNGTLDIPLSLREIAQRSTIGFMTVKRYLPKLLVKGIVTVVGETSHNGGPVKVYHIDTPGVSGSYTLSPKGVSVETKGVSGLGTKCIQPNNLNNTTANAVALGKTENPVRQKTPEASFPYKSLVLSFNRKYGTDLFPTFGKQAKAIKKILQSYTEEDIWACTEWLSRSPFWKEKGFDFSIVLSQIAKYKMSLRSGQHKEVYRDAKSI